LRRLVQDGATKNAEVRLHLGAESSWIGRAADAKGHRRFETHDNHTAANAWSSSTGVLMRRRNCRKIANVSFARLFRVQIPLSPADLGVGDARSDLATPAEDQ